MAWTLNIYKASVDSGAGTPYDTVALGTVTGYSGYATTSTTILAPQATWEFEHFSIKDVSGSQFGRSRRRRVFDVECRPYQFNDSATLQDLTDVDSIADFLDDAAYLWVAITAGSRSYPGGTNVIPVICTGWTEAVNKELGTRGLNIQFAHRYRF